MNRRRDGEMVETVGDDASWRGEMRLEAIIAAAWKAARRGERRLSPDS
ncbi:MAG TPA: hypothetical protein VM557_07480 [Thermoanaerobaculia bacterium]|nr:hypothetical protein [Thermoanaerobaculia bacterium]